MSKGMAHEGDRSGSGHWWRFVPRSSAIGYAAVVIAFLLLVQALSNLLGKDGLSALGMVTETVVAVVSVAWIAQSVDGLQVRYQRREHSHSH